MTSEAASRQEEVVRFPHQIDLTPGSESDLASAAEAVRREYRDSVRWKRLRCRGVTPVTGQDSEAIYALEVGRSVEFDWTWEGAVAFRPEDADGFDGHDGASADPFDTSDGLWSGEVVEVDEANGRVFVWVANPLRPPTTGTFFVRPFEFLAFLNAVYQAPEFRAARRLLPARLNACRGKVHPRLASVPEGGLPALGPMWRHSWGVLWGPPGTGKTYTVGQQVATSLGDAERILVVSTTNKATDGAALSVGKAALRHGTDDLQGGRILRIGKSAGHEAYESDGLDGMLRGTETELLREVGGLSKALSRAGTHEERAVLRKQIQAVRKRMKDASYNAFVSGEVRVVVATAFKALTLLTDDSVRSAVEEGYAPFTTVCIDEAGLISRAAAAALSLLASRRVVLVGDSKQLAPISRISRVLPTSQSMWLGSSGLSHLQSAGQAHDGVHLLREQHRMHPHVCSLVSAYQYENKLLNAPVVYNRATSLPPLLKGHPRAVWYVLDEDGDDLPAIRAERGPGNKSWVRPKTREVLKKVFSDEGMRKLDGLFITPFVAQAREVRRYFAEEGMDSWSAATVHSQQGAEADVVIFDTVNAGSYAWPYDEWKRLVNVGLSRAREFVLLLASRAEMREPYLRPLTPDLSPRVLRWSGRSYKWEEVEAEPEFEVAEAVASNPHLLGSQIKRRQELRPVLSSEQQRLVDLAMDGKPRLVRGVAGSGKTVVLAHWLLRTVNRLVDRPDAKIWAVYANRSLRGLIADTAEAAWKSEGGVGAFPWHRVDLHHVKDLLDTLLPEVGLRLPDFGFDYDGASAAYVLKRGEGAVAPRCHAMFIDEAQDMGPSTLKLLSSLVERSVEGDRNSRSVNIFYDNAQNVYGRGTPKWSELGLDMRGRSTVMKESFRSTRPITEFALNVLYRLQPAEMGEDHKELVERGLIEKVKRAGEDWWAVRFNQVDGPAPAVKKFDSIEDEFGAIGDQLARWIREEGVKPSDICVIYNGPNALWRIETQAGPKLKAVGARLHVQAGQPVSGDPSAVTVTTAQSFKGYDAEVVVVAGVDQFVAKGKGVLANVLYVAMTRARSVLAVYGKRCQNAEKDRILRAVERCLDVLADRPEVEEAHGGIDDFEDVLQRVGGEHRRWLEGVWKSHWVEQEPIVAEDGEIIAEPLFWFETDDRVYACFGAEHPGRRVANRLEDEGVEVITPGQRLA